jgi:homoserine kinase
LLPGGQSRSDATGEGAEQLNQSGGCLVLKAAQHAADHIGGTVPAVFVHIESHIPIQRGLGSSASAVIAGIVAANVLLNGNLSTNTILTLATAMEGHADNVAPALKGGFQTAIYDGTTATSLRLPVSHSCLEHLRLIVCVPEMCLSTGSARLALPASVPHQDAAFNVGRATLLTAALCSGAFDVLRAALQDRLHQPYRASLIPGFAEVIRGAEAAGAYGACLSGSGSTMLGFAPEDRASEVGEAMTWAFVQAGFTARWWSLPVEESGMTVLPFTTPVLK